MGCCGSKPEPEGFSGIKDEDRKCTDVLCCLIFIVCIVACVSSWSSGWVVCRPTAGVEIDVGCLSFPFIFLSLTFVREEERSAGYALLCSAALLCCTEQSEGTQSQACTPVAALLPAHDREAPQLTIPHPAPPSLPQIGTGVYGFMYGNAARLFYGQDMEGNQCGSGTYAAQMLTVYPKMNEDIISAAQEFGGDVTSLASNLDKIKFSGVCVSECPRAREWICSPSGNTTALAKQAADSTYSSRTQQEYLEYCYGLSGGGAYASVALQYTAPNCAEVLGGCWRTPLNTTNILFRCLELYETNTNEASECIDPPGATAEKCLVKKKTTTTEVAEPGQPNYLMDMLNGWANVAMALVGDAMKSYLVILVVAIGGGLVLGFTWLFILRLFAGIIVWATIIVLLLLCGAGTFYAYMKAGLVDSSIASTVSTAAAVRLSTVAFVLVGRHRDLWHDPLDLPTPSYPIPSNPIRSHPTAPTPNSTSTTDPGCLHRGHQLRFRGPDVVVHCVRC